MNRTILIVGSVVAAAAIGAIVFLGFSGREEARVLRPASQTPPAPPPIPPAPPKAIYNVGGVITAVEADHIVFEAEILEGEKETRKALITPSTRITRLIFVTLEGGGRRPQESQISLNSLKAGDRIEVFASQNIRALEEFEATRVSLRPPQ